jgi:hypothetical protein
MEMLRATRDASVVQEADLGYWSGCCDVDRAGKGKGLMTMNITPGETGAYKKVFPTVEVVATVGGATVVDLKPTYEPRFVAEAPCTGVFTVMLLALSTARFADAHGIVEDAGGLLADNLFELEAENDYVFPRLKSAGISVVGRGRGVAGENGGCTIEVVGTAEAGVEMASSADRWVAVVLYHVSNARCAHVRAKARLWEMDDGYAERIGAQR